MLSAIYLGLFALLLLALSVHVIRLRRALRVRLGDGDEPALAGAIRAQANAAEYLPLAALLMIGLELSDGPPVLIHLGGGIMLAGRLIHARGLLTDRLRPRVLGMQLTFLSLAGLALACLGYGGYTYWS